MLVVPAYIQSLQTRGTPRAERPEWQEKGQAGECRQLAHLKTNAPPQYARGRHTWCTAEKISSDAQRESYRTWQKLGGVLMTAEAM